MRLVLGLSPSAIEFTEQNSGGRYPYLLTVGDLHQVARAGTATGIAGTESSSVPVTLGNRGKRLTAIVRRPLRIGAEIYDDDGALFFAGTISAIEYGGVVTWEIDA